MAAIISSSQNALPVCLRNENPNRLVSLLDVLKRYAFSFYEVAVRIEKLRSEARLFATLVIGFKPKKTEAYKRDDVIACLEEMQAECKTLDLTHTSALISFTESEVRRKSDDYTYADMLKDLDTLEFSFFDELRRNSCFRIATEKDRYFQKDDLAGTLVTSAFPSCVSDIRNAGNCFALEQDEATAFHSMRILERGLNALANKFGVDFSHTNWHNVIEEIEKKIRKMDSSFGADWKEQQKVCSQAATHFMFLKDAWRNHFVHGRDIAYDPGRAFSVFDHVRQFMQALAEGGLKETPVP